MFRKPTIVAALALGLAGLYPAPAQATVPNRTAAAARRAAAQAPANLSNTLAAMGESTNIAMAAGAAPVATALVAAIQAATHEAVQAAGVAADPDEMLALLDETSLLAAWVANHPENPWPGPAAVTALANATGMTEAEIEDWFQANVQ